MTRPTVTTVRVPTIRASQGMRGRSAAAAVVETVEVGRNLSLDATNDNVVVTVAGTQVLGGDVGVGFAGAVNLLLRPRALVDQSELSDAGDPVEGSSVRAIIGNSARAMGDVGTGGETGSVAAGLGGTGNITLTATTGSDEFWAVAKSDAQSPGTNDPVPSGDNFRGVDFGFGFSLDAVPVLAGPGRQAIRRTRNLFTSYGRPRPGFDPKSFPRYARYP